MKKFLSYLLLCILFQNSLGQIVFAQSGSGQNIPVKMVTPKASIISVVPGVIIPEKTEVVVTGSGFGSSFFSGKNQICINTACLADDSVSTYLISWSDTSIHMRLPAIPGLTSGSISLLLWQSFDPVSGSDLYDLVKSSTVTFVSQPEPEITSFFPREVVPEVTTLTLLGKGFGQNYIPASNQICFQTKCIADESISKYLVSWSDTQIQVLVPGFVSQFDAPQILIKLLSPTQGYAHFATNDTLVVVPRPQITQYYPMMESGTRYKIFGRNFGDLQGTLFLAGEAMSVEEWTNQTISFQTPDHPLTGGMEVHTATQVISASLPVQVTYVERFSDDPYSKLQTYFHDLNIKDAWQKTEGSPSVIVAVIDSGVDMTHEDLQGAFWKNPGEVEGNGKDDDGNGFVDDIYGWDFVQNSNNTIPVNEHGTMVASVIAAQKDNRIGISGIAPKVKIMSLNVTSKKDGTVDHDYLQLDSVLKAVKYAVDNGASVINLSFNGNFSNAYTSVLQYAYDHNVLVVASAGNDTSDLDTTKSSPVCNDIALNAIIGVASVGSGGLLSSFSNIGKTCLDLSAPGEGIVTAYPAALNQSGLAYRQADGTSFSAPIVSATAALLKSLHPDWNREEIKAAILNSTSPFPVPSEVTSQGKIGGGILNIGRALASARPNVSYNANPAATVTLQETKQNIEVEKPIVTPLTDPTKTAIPNLPSTSTPFPDVLPNDKEVPAIRYLKEHHVINGYADGTFRPTRSINRAEFLKILLEAQGVAIPDTYKNCFQDVKDEWYAKYICYASSKGFISGYGDPKQPSTHRTFRPAATINKVEAVKMIFAVYQLSVEGGEKVTFKDVPANAWYLSYLAKALQLNLLEEEGQSLFAPGALMTRAGISEILYKYLSGKSV